MGNGPALPASNGPSTTTWRRERLMRIGSGTTINAVAAASAIEGEDSNAISESPTECSSLPFNTTSYGTLPRSRHRGSSLTIRGTIPQTTRRRSNASALPTPSIRDLTFSRLSIERPISAYDAPLQYKGETDADTKVNGIRVWYSSFSSIDWLHDAIKDSARFSRLRNRKSFRSRLRLAIDKSLGWLVVTIVGFLSAIVAFLVVRSETFLFDIKEGYCHGSWWKAKRYCCPVLDYSDLTPRIHEVTENCPRWKSWIDILSPGGDGLAAKFTGYAIHISIAVGGSNDANHKQAAGSGIPEVKTILSGAESAE
ncbi:hypothetical protein H0H93_012391 [Arthromyces matolae]|nr:hypothetical protein H0H93_012391 [Arthromyces matolae]